MNDFKTLNNLVPEIVSIENLNESFDYVVKDLKPEQEERLRKKKRQSKHISVNTLWMVLSA